MEIRAAGIRRWYRRTRAERPAGGDWKQFQRERIEGERTLVRTIHGDIGLAVLDILARHDPMDIVRPENPAEYEPMVRTVLPRLRSARCVEEACRIVYEEAANWLTPAHAGPERAYVQIGHEVWEAAKRHR